VDFRVAEGVSALEDLDLLRTALKKLLGSAWNFPAKRLVATVSGKVEFSVF
jgi:hypothetical protein